MPLLMVRQHLVRVGAVGQVGRFTPVEPLVVPRGGRVICRTRRGLEVGEVLGDIERRIGEDDGQLLRRVTVEDDLLLARIAQRQQSAFDACTRWLGQRGVPAVLIDVEHLFDGQSLYFYFLGPPPTEVEQLTAELAATYEAEVKLGEFAEAVANGCGPGCGTEEAAGCGTKSGGCSSCSLATACAVKHH